MRNNYLGLFGFGFAVVLFRFKLSKLVSANSSRIETMFIVMAKRYENEVR